MEETQGAQTEQELNNNQEKERKRTLGDLQQLSSEEWRTLLQHVAVLDDVSDLKQLLAPLLHCPAVSLAFIQNYARQKKFGQLEELFELVLLEESTSAHWLAYLNYLEATGRETKIILEAYETSVKHNTFFECGELWLKYIAFVEKCGLFGAYEDARRNEYLKSLYRRASTVPNNRLDLLWAQYKDMAETSEDHHSAYLRSKEEAGRYERSFSTDRTPSSEEATEARIHGTGMELILAEELQYKKTKTGFKKVMEVYKRAIYTFPYWKELYLRYVKTLIEAQEELPKASTQEEETKYIMDPEAKTEEGQKEQKGVEVVIGENSKRKEALWAEAEKILRLGHTLMPDAKDILDWLIELLERGGKIEEALKHLLAQGRKEESLALARRTGGLEECRRRWNEMKQESDSRLYFYIGALEYNTEGNGYATFEEGLLRDPEDVEYQSRVLSFLYARGCPEDAFLFFETAGRAGKTRQEYWDIVLENEKLFYADTTALGKLLDKRRRESDGKPPKRASTNKKEGRKKNIMTVDQLLEKKLPPVVLEIVTKLPFYSTLEPPNITLLLNTLLQHIH